MFAKLTSNPTYLLPAYGLIVYQGNLIGFD